MLGGAIDNFLEAEAVIVDILLLSEGDFFVGKFSSNIDRIAFSLIAARKQGVVPYVSLDSPWCFDFGVKAGKLKSGWEFNC